MDLSTIWYTLQDLSQQYSRARSELKLYQFNNALQMANSDALLNILNMAGSRSAGVEKNEEQLDLLAKFVTFSDTPAGTSSIPSGFVRCVDGSCSVTIAGTSTIGTQVERVSLEEYSDRVSNSLTAPSSTYPVFFIQGSYVYAYPSGFGTFRLYYYTDIPSGSAPELVLKSENGVNVYDSDNSTELSWPDYMYPSIVMGMLKYLGISVTDQLMVEQKLKEINNSQ
jgi:hypothetical protein